MTDEKSFLKLKGKNTIVLKLKEKEKPRIKLKIRSDAKECVSIMNQAFRTIKCPLKKILKHYGTLHPLIEQYISEVNRMVMIGYEFAKFYVLDLYEKHSSLPIIDRQFFITVLKTVCIKNETRGRPSNKTTTDTKQQMNIFYEHVFSMTMRVERPSYSHKNHLITELANHMATTFSTNMKTHFIKYLFKYVNIVHRAPRSKIIRQEKDKDQRKQLYSQLKKDMADLKHDLIMDTITHSRPEYHDWIRENRSLLLPETIDNNVPYDLKSQTFQYVKHAIYINQQIENLGCRPNQIFPQRSSHIPHFILLNSSSVVEMLSPMSNIFNKILHRSGDVDKYASTSELMNHAGSYQHEIWSHILELDDHIFNQNPYEFYYQMRIDGFGCCLLFVHKDKKNMKHGDKNEQGQDVEEFRQLSDLTVPECQKILTGKYKVVSNDPGETDPLSMINSTGCFFQYSALRRRTETYTKRTTQIINNEKTKNGIYDKERALSNMSKPPKKKKKMDKRSRRKKKKEKEKTLETVKEVRPKVPSSRTTHVVEFEKFISSKHKIESSVRPFYERILFRKLGFRRYVRTLQSEQHLIQEIRHKYLTDGEISSGYNLVIFYGNHSRGQMMKGCTPCPGIGLKRLLSRHFEVLETDEHLTSVVHYRRLERMENLVVRRGHHTHKVHKILTLQEDPARCIFINRDYNASRNILSIGNEYLQSQTRPKAFCRNRNEGNSMW